MNAKGKDMGIFSEKNTDSRTIIVSDMCIVVQNLLSSNRHP